MIDLKAPEDILSDRAFWDEMAAELAVGLGSVCRRTVTLGAQAAEAAGVIVDFDAIHREALIMTRGTESIYWRMMTQTTRDSLREALVMWQETGLGKRGLPDLIDAIQPLFSPERARRIAVTETTRLFAEGNKLAAQMDDAVGGLQLQTAGDERVCAICGPLNHQIFPKDNVPEQPAHVNCRCRIIPTSWRYISEHETLWQGGGIPEGAYV